MGVYIWVISPPCCTDEFDKCLSLHLPCRCLSQASRQLLAAVRIPARWHAKSLVAWRAVAGWQVGHEAGTEMPTQGCKHMCSHHITLRLSPEGGIAASQHSLRLLL